MHNSKDFSYYTKKRKNRLMLLRTTLAEYHILNKNYILPFFDDSNDDNFPLL